MTNEPTSDEPMTRVDAIVELYRMLVDAYVEGDQRLAGTCQQAIADLIQPPQVDLTSPDTIHPSQDADAEAQLARPYDRTPISAPELREVYRRLRLWADDIPDPAAVDRFTDALHQLDQLGQPDDLSPDQQNFVVEHALYQLVPNWVPPRVSDSPDAVRSARRSLAGGPDSVPDAGPTASADAAADPPSVRRAAKPGPDGPKRR